MCELLCRKVRPRCNSNAHASPRRITLIWNLRGRGPRRIVVSNNWTMCFWDVVIAGRLRYLIVVKGPDEEFLGVAVDDDFFRLTG